MIIGSYIPFSQIDGFTKALLERFWSFHHTKKLLKGKLCATVLTGLDPKVLEAVNSSLVHEIRETELMELMGQLTIQGNLPCAFCEKGDECETSGVRRFYGPDVITSEIGYARVEDQEKVWEEAARIGRQIEERLQKSDSTTDQ